MKSHIYRSAAGFVVQSSNTMIQISDQEAKDILLSALTLLGLTTDALAPADAEWLNK